MSLEREHTDRARDDLEPAAEARTPGRTNRAARLLAPKAPVLSGLVQREANAATTQDGAGHAVAEATGSTGSPLPESLAQKFESSLGTDLSAVRVHTGTTSAAAAEAVSAKAYTLGDNIHFAAGQFDPTSAQGQHLLAHEVAHTVQQRGQEPRRQNKLAVSTPEDAAEREADVAADAMIEGREATVSPISDGIVQLRPAGPVAPDGVYSTAWTREFATKAGIGGGGNAVDQALHAFDWAGFRQFLQDADTTRTQYETNAPLLDTDLDAITQGQSHWKASLEESYEQEKGQIEQVLNSDPEVRNHVKNIQSKGAQITEKLKLRNEELGSADAALDTLAGLKDAKEAEDEKEKAEKLEQRKKTFEADKASALKDIADQAKLLKGAVDFAHNAISDGVPKAAAKLGTGAIKDSIVYAYSEWASGPINAEYNARIRAISAKIASAQSNIKSLTSSSLSKQISGASKAFAAAMGKVEAHNAAAGRLKKEVDGHRAELEQTMKTKHTNIALFSLTRTASQEMAPLIDNYRATLVAARGTLDPMKTWTKWQGALQKVKSAVSSTDRVIGGDADALQDANMKELIDHQMMPEAVRKQREESARRLVQRYQSVIGPASTWLTQYGQWIDSELQFVGDELDKCLAGEFTAFIREIEGKIHALIDKKYL